MKSLKDLMSEELPTLTHQRRRLYRAKRREVSRLFDLINQEVFDNKLPKPKIVIKTHVYKCWATCQGFYEREGKRKSKCVITLSRSWYCKQWLITVLAHEMVHQHQWDIEGIERELQGKEPIMSHGPSFFKFKQKLKTVNIPLKHRMSTSKWFVTQNMFRC